MTTPLTPGQQLAFRFGGETYCPALDKARLTAQARKVFDLMSDGEWRTLAEISAATGAPEASVSARLRDYRKAQWGSMDVERRRRTVGTWEYRIG